MIPNELMEQWESVRARAELLFLADHGGGIPDALVPCVTPSARRVALRRLGFRVAEEYSMPRDILLPNTRNDMVPWLRLTNDVGVDLETGFVIRTHSGGILRRGGHG